MAEPTPELEVVRVVLEARDDDAAGGVQLPRVVSQVEAMIRIDEDETAIDMSLRQHRSFEHGAATFALGEGAMREACVEREACE